VAVDDEPPTLLAAVRHYAASNVSAYRRRRSGGTYGVPASRSFVLADLLGCSLASSGGVLGPSCREARLPRLLAAFVGRTVPPSDGRVIGDDTRTGSTENGAEVHLRGKAKEVVLVG
jgi:hypothetical protein